MIEYKQHMMVLILVPAVFIITMLLPFWFTLTLLVAGIISAAGYVVIQYKAFILSALGFTSELIAFSLLVATFIGITLGMDTLLNG